MMSSVGRVSSVSRRSRLRGIVDIYVYIHTYIRTYIYTYICTWEGLGQPGPGTEGSMRHAQHSSDRADTQELKALKQPRVGVVVS
jgi:hypothetical protein